MKEIINILNELINVKDIENKTNLIDGKILTSSNIIRLVSRLNNEFDIEISPLDLIPENFNSVASINALVERLDLE